MNPAVSSEDKLRVYCAGPLFNQAERDEMTRIADLLTDTGYDVYLPHRDGMEFRLILEELTNRNWEPVQAAAFLHAAIFALDVYQLAEECQAMVWNLNGRVPDEGAVSEAAMAWTLGKPLVAFSNDVRSLIAGRINPLLVGMVDFETIEEDTQIPDRLSEKIVQQGVPPYSLEKLPAAVRKTVLDGRKLWKVLQETDATLNDALIADAVEELFAPVQEQES